MRDYDFGDGRLLSVSIELTEECMTAINQEDFRRLEYERVHVWQHYVPYAYRAAWQELSQDTRNAVYNMASMIAFAENWD